jgi:hypothetical protein
VSRDAVKDTAGPNTTNRRINSNTATIGLNDATIEGKDSRLHHHQGTR